MTTTLSEGVKVPDVGSVNWAGDLEVNWNLLNGALANLSGNVKLDRDNTWTGEQSFTLPIVGSITGTASKAIADEDGTSIKTGYGKLAGNQTWTGSNTFTDSLTFKNNAVVVGATTGYGYSAFNYVDSNNSSIAYHRVSKFTSGNTCLQWKIYNTNNNSESISAEIQYYLTKTGERVFTPNSNGDTTLGTSSYRWSSVYADSYYYGTTAWGLDKSNVWSASNTFNQAVISNSSFWITSADLQAKNQSTLISARLNKIGNESSDGKAFQKFEMKVDATYSETAYCVNYYNTSGNIAYDFVIRQRVDNQGTKQFYPSVSGAADLGTSTNKWKTLNGINPGALSLPNKDKRIEIDTTGWTYTGSYANQILINNATQTISGWLYIRIENTTASDYVTIRMNAVAIENPTLIQPGSSATPVISVLFPVVAGVPVYVYATKAPAKIYLYECLGNV